MKRGITLRLVLGVAVVQAAVFGLLVLLMSMLFSGSFGAAMSGVTRLVSEQEGARGAELEAQAGAVEKALGQADEQARRVVLGLYDEAYTALIEAAVNEMFPLAESFDVDGLLERAKKEVAERKAVKWVRCAISPNPKASEVIEAGTRQAEAKDIKAYRTVRKTSFAYLQLEWQVSLDGLTSLDEVHRLFVEIGQRQALLSERNREASARMQRAVTELAKERAEAEAREFGRLLVAVLAGLLVVSLAALYAYLRRGLVRPLQDMSSRLSKASASSLANVDELGHTSTSLADGATKQAAAVEETESSLGMIAVASRENSELASRARDLIQGSSQAAGTASKAVDELAAHIRELARAGEETQKIVKTIDEIAFQTNILALNAAVEAARAGESGAGFAVVAGEVRALAQRAAEAAKSTSAILTESAERITRGNAMVSQTCTSFREVAEGTRSASDIVTRIASSSENQVQSVEQIRAALVDISAMTQENVSTAESAATVAKDLNATANSVVTVARELSVLVEGDAAGSAGDAA